MFFRRSATPEYSTALTNDACLDNILIEKHKKTITSIKSHLKTWEKQRDDINNPETKKAMLTEMIATANISLSLLLDLDATLSKNWKWQYVITQQQRSLLKALYYRSSASNVPDVQALLNELQNNSNIFEPLYYVHVVEHNRYIEYAQFFKDQETFALLMMMFSIIPILILAIQNATIALLIVASLTILPAAAVHLLAVPLLSYIANQYSNESITNDIAKKIGHLNAHLKTYKELDQSRNDTLDDDPQEVMMTGMLA